MPTMSRTCRRRLGTRSRTTAGHGQRDDDHEQPAGNAVAVAPIDRSNSEPVTTTASTIRNACTMKPVVEVRTPELTATAGGRPCFWKKRMLRVALPAVPPTRPVKALANCTAVTGPNGSRADTAPSIATDWDNWGSWREDERQQHPPPDRVLEDVAHGGDARRAGRPGGRRRRRTRRRRRSG